MIRILLFQYDLVNSGVLPSFNLIKELFLITGQKIGHRKNPNEEADFYVIPLHGKGWQGV